MSATADDLSATAAPAGPARPGGVFSGPYRRLSVGIVATVAMVAFEGMAVATVMPVAVDDLGGLPWYAWGFSAFLIASLVAMVVAGEWCDRRGPRGVFIVAGGLFAAGLVAAGLAPGMAVFIAARALQGFGMGLVIVAIYVVVAHSYPDAMRPRVFSYIAGAWVVPAMVGPALAGWVAAAVSWRWAFLGVLPFVVPAMALVLPALTGHPEPPHREREPAPGSRRQSRVAAALAVAAGTAVLQYAGQRLDLVALPLAVAGAALLAYAAPRVLPRGTLRASRGLPTSVLMRGVLAAAFFGAEAFIPLMLVQERGLRPGTAGLVLTGAALGWATGSWYQGRPSTPVPRHRLVQAGCVFVLVAIASAAATVLPAVPVWVVAAGCVVGGLGMGIAMSSVSVLVLEQSTVAERGANSAGLQLADALLSTISIGVGGAIFALGHRAAGQDGPVFVTIYAVMLLIAVTGVVLAPRVRAPEPSGALLA